MDEAIDQMNKTVKAINLFEVHSFSPEMREMGLAIVRVAELTAEAIPLMRAIGANAPQLSAFAEEVIRVEDRCDELHEAKRRAIAIRPISND
jgi:uncharacterized protein Yka (UPF0111/DUF47 family)